MSVYVFQNHKLKVYKVLKDDMVYYFEWVPNNGNIYDCIMIFKNDIQIYTKVEFDWSGVKDNSKKNTQILNKEYTVCSKVSETNFALYQVNMFFKTAVSILEQF
jgi:hypothetical protein